MNKFLAGKNENGFFEPIRILGGAVQVAAGAAATRIATVSPYTYIGEAEPGTADTDAAWRIQRIDSSGNVTWKDGNADFVNVWESSPGSQDFAGYTYS